MILRSLEVKAYHLCVVLYVITLLYAVESVQLPRDQRQHAVCSLTLQGHPDPATLGVAAADLHCTSSSPIPIGINQTYLGRFSSRFTGVQVISNLACQQQAKGYSTVKGARVPLFALVYFCGDYHVTLQQPSVRNVSLIFNNDAWNSAAVAFGAQTEVSIRQGRFTGNSAASTLIAFQQATVSVSDGTVLEYNQGRTGAGVAVIDNGKLTLTYASLRYNHAQRSGGAVFCDHNASVSITSTEFHNNTAMIGGGGVLVFSQAPAVVANSTFSQNYAGYGGGAVACDGCLLSITNTAFTNNSAAQVGGGVDAVNAAQVTSVNSTWLSNRASMGAALHLINTPSPGVSRNTSATLNITANSFTSNNATGRGGGLYLENLVEAVVANSLFSENYAGFGGGLMTFEKAKLTIQDSFFVLNEAATSGGAVYLDNPSTAVVHGCAYTGNHAKFGGGVYCNGCLLTTISTAFTNNSAADNGGGVFCDGCFLTTIGTAFANNSAGGYGGGLNVANAAQVTSVDSTWHRNTAANGAALAMTNTPSPGASRNISATLNITANNFTNNNATGDGGGLRLQDLIEAVVANSTFSQNYAGHNGGGLGALGKAELTIQNSFFMQSKAANSGGAVYLESHSLTVTIVSSSWHSNTAYVGAGLAIGNTPGTDSSDKLPAVLSITDSTFVNNSANTNGGGLSLQDHVQANITRSNLSANTAGVGGAMYTGITATVILSCIFSRNNASFGGALYYAMDHNTLTLTHSILNQNFASETGGGLGADGVGKLAITAVNCTGNLAGGAGGAMDIGGISSAGGVAKVTIIKSSFNANRARAGGGLVLSGQVQALVSDNCSFIGNSAEEGGAVSLGTLANLTIENSTLQGNLARQTGYGGAICQESSTTALITAGSKILDNTAFAGGGSFCGDSAQITVTADSLVQGNRAYTGGGFFAQQNASVILRNSTLHGNHANSRGGGVALIDGAHANLSSCYVIGNTAGDQGGGLNASIEAVLVLSDSLVANNTASNSGGGISIEETAQLLMFGNTSVTNNAVTSDDGRGGGVSLYSGGFDLAQVKRAVQGNIASFDSNIESKMTNITIRGNASVAGLVNSIGKDEGLLQVAVNTSGYHGMPCQGLLVQAMLADGTILGWSRSDQYGMAYMSFKVARPPGLYTVSFKSPGAWQLPAANLSLQIRGCVRGEVTPTPDTCQQCQPGYFSFEPQQAVCDTCPANANCTGGDVILPLPGYWRSSADSTQVHRCLNPSACLISNQAALQSCAADSTCGASSTFKDLQCSPDYVGNLCGVCAAGRGATKLFVCKSCMATSHIIALYIIAAIVMLLFIKLLCYLTLNQARNVGMGDTSKLPAAELLRPLILYSQYMLIVSSMNVEWPASLSYPLKVLGWVWSPASPETLSIDCILPKNSSLPVSIQKVLFYVCMPVALLLFLTLTELAILGVRRMLLAQQARRHAVVVDMKDRLLSSTLVAVFFFLPSVLRTVFSMFACTQIDQHAAAPYAPAAVGSFWVYDIDQQCFAGYHRAWALGLGLPLVLIVCLGLPSGILFLLLRNNGRLQEEPFMQQYGFLYRSYRDGFCFWECIILLQTMLLVATSVFGVNMGVFYQLIVINGVFTLIAVVLLAFRPYLYPQAGRVMLQAICCLLLTSYVSLTFLQVSDVQPSPVYGLVMGSILLVINLAFIISVLWQLARLVDWQGLVSIVQRFVQRLVDKSGLLSKPGVKGLVVQSKPAPFPVSV